MAQVGTVNADLLNMRVRPSTDSEIKAQLPKGTSVQVLKEADADWLQVKVDSSGTQGFVMKKFLTVTESKPVPVQSAAAEEPYSRGLQKTRGSFFGRIRQALGGTS